MAADMPNADPKEKRTANLPPQLWQELEAIAKLTGNSLSEILRRCVELGLSEEQKRLTANLSYENAQLVNRKLKQRQEDLRVLVDTLAATLANPDATAQDRADALEMLKKRLMD